MRLRPNDTLRWPLSALLVAAGGAALAAHPLYAAVAGNRRAYELGTVVLLALAVAVPAAWPPSCGGETPAVRPRLTLALATLLAGMAVLFRVASLLLPAVFAGPVDPMRGDMLVIMDQAVTRLLNGQNPYGLLHVPWDTPLTYGPLLWLPHVIPRVLGLDFRILTLVAQLVIPGCCFLAAAIRAGQGKFARAVVLFGLGAGAALHPGLLDFHPIGHTQVYWPLLPLLCLCLQQSRWTAAAICLGALVSARTPMIALAPVFFLHLQAKHQLTLTRVLAFGLAVILPFAPFLIADAHAVKDGLFDTYMRVMKTYVWTSTDWAIATYGITGRLLQYGLQRYVEVTQIAALALVYAAAWRSLALGRRVEPWLGLALLVFAMTTLWSVTYLYFDVWLLLASALVVCDESWRALPAGRPALAVPLSALMALTAVGLTASIHPGAAYKLDIGSPEAAGYTGGGFGRDVVEQVDGRSVVWIEGATARIRVPRAGWSGATLRLAIQPYIPSPGAPQTVMASLNGRVLGRVSLQPGWQEVSFQSRRTDWLYGFNVLDLLFAYAAPAPGRSAVLSPTGDPRALAAAIDYLTIE